VPAAAPAAVSVVELMLSPPILLPGICARSVTPRLPARNLFVLVLDVTLAALESAEPPCLVAT
jgi:hypothetical protein